MSRRLPVSFLAPALLWAAWVPANAAAAPKDAAALKLDQAAINNDYLATKFGDAEKKLRQGLALCGANNCSPKTLAQLHCDLGVVLFVGSKKTDEAKAQFAEALKADPTAAIAKELTSPEIEQVFAAAKGGAATPAPAPAPAAPAAPAADEITHTPAAEQLVLTAVPVYAELPEGMNPAKVQLRYKPFGVTDWKSTDLKRLKNGYGGEVPCADVGSTPGDLRYYIEAVDAKGDVIGTSGTRNAPYKVPIKAQITGEAPHLPGSPASAQCPAGAAIDCPPGLPGCGEKKKAGDKGAGAACDEDAQCSSGSCKDAVCTASESSLETTESAKKNWFSVALQQDASLLPSGTNVCNDAEYQCFDASDKHLDSTDLGQGTDVGGGPKLATTRVIVGYERLMGANLTVGLKAGYAFNGGLAKKDDPVFLPVHAEVRVAYWLGLGGVNPFTVSGVRPYFVASGGIGQVDAKVDTKGILKGSVGKSDVNAWHKAGPGFGSLGAGVAYALTPATAIFAEVKVSQFFGASGTGASLQVGVAQGL